MGSAAEERGGGGPAAPLRKTEGGREAQVANAAVITTADVVVYSSWGNGGRGGRAGGPADPSVRVILGNGMRKDRPTTVRAVQALPFYLR